MTRRLEGKVAVITGTAGGQGAAAAELFAREGAMIVGCDVKAEESAAVTQSVCATGGTMVSLEPCDLSSAAGAQQVIDLAMATFGRIDVLYNNAGRPAFAPVDVMTDEQWRFTMANELDSVFYTSRAAWPHLAANGKAVIINTASLNGHRVVHGLPAAAHTSSKAAVSALTRQLAIEGGPLGIRAVSISPGIVLSPATAAQLKDPEARRVAYEHVVLGRLGEPMDVAHLALFLASDEASWITGVDYLIDGGGSML
ncbi:SDR family NAD(P)-dependent oxidoreductase [Microbacterium album]|uniref:Short-chain dehydrogenase n=1 Tax=Microbacterium album TaxID=2053191 RepID=A0A917MM47_9MICO|nr:SDR family oxidoreductase [Microbacterium album]GGH33523.1 short-chain dehydrogenase [Microbacterium album]